MDSEVFKAALNYAFFKVTEKAEDLFVQLDEGRFELLYDVVAEMVGVLCLGERLAGVVLVRFEVGGWGSGEDVKGNFNVLAVSDFF